MVITTILFFVVARDALGLVARPRRCSSSRRCCSSTAPSSPPTSRRSPTAAGSRSSSRSCCSCRWPRGGTGRELVADRIRRGERADRRGPRRAPRRHACARHRRVPVQGPRQGATGAHQQPAPQQGPPREHAPRRRRDRRRPPRRARTSAARSTELEPGLHQVLLRFGFMEEPDVPAALAAARAPGRRPRRRRRHLLRRPRVGHRRRRSRACTPPLEHLYALLHRGADSASRFFNLPADRVFEVGTHVEI